MSLDPLALDPEAMRRLGYLTVDMLVSRLSNEAEPPLSRATPAEMADRLGGPPPAQDYLRDAEAVDAEVNFADLGLQLTRTSRALKCWMSLRYFGIEAFRAAIDQSLDLAELAAARVERSATLELMTRPSLGVVCFSRRFEGEPDEVFARNARLVAALEQSGLALVSSTRLDGRYAIRLCVLNHTTTAEDVVATLDFLETAEVPPGPSPATESHERERDLSSSWVFAELAGDPTVALLPLFHGLSPDEVERVRARAQDSSRSTAARTCRWWRSLCRGRCR